MATIIGNLRAVLGLDSTSFQQGLKTASRDMKKVGDDFRKVGKRVAAVGAAVSVASTGIVLGIRKNLQAADEIGKMAQKIGLPVEELGRLSHAADMSGVKMGDLENSMRRLSRNMVDTPDRFEELGIAVRDADGNMRASQDVLDDVADLLAGMPDGAEKTAIAFDLMGRSGTAMIPMLNGGAKALQDMRDEADALGIVFSKETTDAAQEFNDNWSRLTKQFAGIGTVITAQIAPALLKISDLIVDMAKAFRNLSPETQKIIGIIAGVTAVLGPLLIGIGLTVTALGTLAPAFAAVTAAVAGITAPFALAAAAIATAAVAIYNNWDDVGPWLGGVFSAIGQQASGLADVIWGVVTGDMSRAVDGLKDIWVGFGDFWRLIWEGVRGTLTWAWETGIKPVLDYLGWTDTIVAAWESMRSAIGSTIEYIGEKLEWLMGFLQPVLDGLSWLRDKGAGVVDGIGGAAGRAWGGLKGLFSSDGDVADGLAAGTDAAGAQGAADAQAYEAGWRRGMGIQSPSTVMQQIGQFAMQGLGLGVAEGIPSVEGPAQELGDTIKDRLVNSLQRVIEGTMSLRDAFRNMLQDMASSLLSSGLKSAMDAVFGGLFGGGFGFGGFSIPGFATGTAHFRGGMATLHERGGELAIMPSGSTVIPHDLSKRMLEGGQSTGAVDVRVYMDEGGNWKAEAARIAGKVSVQVVSDHARRQSDRRYQTEGQ